MLGYKRFTERQFTCIHIQIEGANIHRKYFIYNYIIMYNTLIWAVSFLSSIFSVNDCEEENNIKKKQKRYGFKNVKKRK